MLRLRDFLNCIQTRTVVPSASNASLLFFALALVVLLTGCSEEREPAVVGEVRHEIFTAYQQDSTLALGHAVYQKHCVGCHGETGDGNGPSASWMNPKPRNFQTALYKFTSTPAGSLPTDEDLMRVLDHGLTGSAMPRFNLVSTEEREAVIAYIKTFSERWETDERKSPVPMGDDPWLNDPVGGILEGEYLYHTIATCWQCHPGYVGLELLNEFNVDAERPALPNLPEAYFESKIRQTPDGDPILAPDFTFDYIKTGVELHTLFYRIGAGITGAAMPAWAYALDASDIWAISYYVQYLSKEHRKDIIRGEVIPFGEKHPEGIYDMVVKEEETDAELETSSADDMVDEDIEEEYEEEEEEEEE